MPHGVPAPSIVVLGCAIRASGSAGGLAGAGGRRVACAARAYAALSGSAPEVIVVASGGRAWNGIVEADGLFRELVRQGVPEGRIVRERLSLSTRENARFVAEVLSKRGSSSVVLVTCAWHLPRAAALFRREGLVVHGAAAHDPGASAARRAFRWGRERLAARLDGLRNGVARRGVGDGVRA